ncbi:MAG: heavy metal translocating P-type ATPase [Anaerotignum sp.]|nr:heavy metal translocating P-type ATPase [Anaerotignum sp.]
MDFQIKHEIKGRLRVHFLQDRMTCKQADDLLFYLYRLPGVTSAKVYEQTADALVCFTGERSAVIQGLKDFCYEKAEATTALAAASGRELNCIYRERLLRQTLLHFGGKLFIPYAVRALFTAVKSVKFIGKGLQSLCRGKLEVSVLDAVAIGVSVFRGEMNTASSVMYLLGVGETLEEWTHKKSVDDLARSMSLQIGKVWLLREGQEVLVPAAEVEVGDSVVVRMGNVIPFDGIIRGGEAMVNQASMTGEAMPVRKEKDGYVYAGTVVEEGEIILQVKETTGTTRFEKIVSMIEDSEKLKSAAEGRAEHLADCLVPYTLLGTGLVWALTRNAAKALAVLMVDFSCALKLAMPISVLSAIREASLYHITVKGGKYLEAVAEAQTIVFDKTGTLTKARPTVKAVYSFCEKREEEMLRIAACLEEHFPHSMAKAVVTAAKEKGLEHEEMHTKVEYIVAHGIASSIEGKKVIIGSAHFVFEDEGCIIEEEQRERFRTLPKEYSHLYLAMDGKLAAVICIEDPLREEAESVIRSLKQTGFRKVVMMTGDNAHTAAAIAAKVGVDEYDSQVLPEDKANFIQREKAKGHTVIMVGDGINDSPALSAADVGIAISDGAEIAREIADITIAADSLYEIITLKHLSDGMMRRIHRNYRMIVGINAVLIVLGVAGVIMPTTSALLHNASTLGISLKSMGNILT